jgi:hypothetical protein
MAVSSLNKFTVPLSTNQSASSQGLLMPKLKFRFRVTLENFGISQPTTELTKQVMDFTRPQVAFNQIEIPIYNSRVYLAGRPEWQASTIQFRDDAGGQVAKLVGEQVQKQFDFMEQSGAAAGIDYKFVTRCEILDGGNGANEATVLETWEMYGCYLQDINYNNVDYSTNDPVTITAQIRYDNAVQTPIGTGIGTAVGENLVRSVAGVGAITG